MFMDKTNFFDMQKLHLKFSLFNVSEANSLSRIGLAGKQDLETPAVD